MAGIGFELKKLLNRKSILMSSGGYFYATFISVGPLLICIGFLVIMRAVLRSMGTPIMEQNMLLAGITYSFMGALFFSGIFGMTISRYISDMIYTSREEKIFPSFVTTIGISITIAGVAGFIFFVWWATLPLLFEVLCYILLISLTVTFLVMVYVSGIKNYRRITMSFIIGCTIGFFVEEMLTLFFKVNVVYSILAGLDVAFIITALLMIVNVYNFFKVHDDSYFGIFKYIKKMPKLMFINSLYLAGIFGHSVIIWHYAPLSLNVANSYLVAPLYDVPAFYALLTVMPAMVIFVVKTETTFYDYYKEYMKMLAGGGTLNDLRHAGETMREHMYTEIVGLLQIQLMITALSIVLARFVFPLMGFSELEFAFFGYMALAYFCIIGTHVISSIILYFDDQKSSLQIMCVFFGLHMILVLLSVSIGLNAVGLGSTVAGVLTLVFAFFRLRKMVRSIDYRLYCSQPIGIADDE
jgi:polysaccharide biosynthesis protein PelG